MARNENGNNLTMLENLNVSKLLFEVGGNRVSWAGMRVFWDCAIRLRLKYINLGTYFWIVCRLK